MSRGGVRKKHYIVDVTDATLVVNSLYDKFDLGNGTEIGAKAGWAFGPIGVGIGLAIGSMMDKKANATSGALQLVYGDGKKLDLICTGKELGKLNEVILGLFGVSISMENPKNDIMDISTKSEAIQLEENLVKKQEDQGEKRAGDADDHSTKISPNPRRDLYTEILRLDELRTKGVISEEEFGSLKKKLVDDY